MFPFVSLLLSSIYVAKVLHLKNMTQRLVAFSDMSEIVASDEIFGDDSFDFWSDSSEWSDEVILQPRKQSARILLDSSDDGAQVEVGGSELVRFHSESFTTETSANLEDDSN